MSPSDNTLLERWQEQRDANAFQEIVARHGAMVYAVCRRIVRNASDAEEIAQECFLALAQTDAGAVRTLGGWLHRLATHRSLDRRRSDSRRGNREQIFAEAQPVHTEPTWPELQQFVDEAIAELPDEQNALIVAHYLEGVTKTELAASLNVAPSTISRRIDRGIDQVRESLRKRGVVVGAVALAGMLPQAASAAAPKTLYASLAKLAISGSRRVPTAAGVAGTGTAIPFAAKLALSVFGVVAIGAAGFVYRGVPETPRPNVSVAVDHSRTPVPAQIAASTTSIPDIEAESSPVNDTASVSGVVVFRDTGEPAPNMRVLIGTEDNPHTTVTDETGSFVIKNMPFGMAGAVAYDARHTEMPEEELRSEHASVNVASAAGVDDIRIEVPPLGGEVSGTVTDKDTGAPLAGIEIEAYGPGTGRHVKTARDGRYAVFGLGDGEYRVRISGNNPMLVHDYGSERIERVMVKSDKATELNFTVDRSISIAGLVVDSDGAPVSSAAVRGVLYTGDQGRRHRGSTSTDRHGRFVLWGGVEGERVLLNATQSELASESVSVKTVPGEPIRNIVLTLYPKQTVTGQFRDEFGRPLEAELWCRSTHPDGPGEWRKQTDNRAKAFQVSLARGKYEIHGRVEANHVRFLEKAQTLEVLTRDLRDIVVLIPSRPSTKGDLTLSGTVRDDNGALLKRTRVYIDGAVVATRRIRYETHTDAWGRFSFANLLEGDYRVHATPNPPYERVAGFDRINPANSPEVEIVVRRAGRLSGRVVDASTGEAVTDFTVEVGSYGGPDAEKRWDFRSIKADSGQFSLTSQLDEDWFLRIEADGYAEAMQVGSALASGEVVDDIVFELERGRIVRGTVANSAGQSIAGALVFDNADVFDVIRGNSRFAAATTDIQGRFIIESIAADAQFLYVSKPGFAVADAPIDDEVSFVLSEGGAIDGYVTVGGIVPSGRISVSVSTGRNGHLEHYSSRADETGYFRMEHLSPGSYRLQFSHRDDTGQHLASYYTNLSVSVVDGSTTTQDLSIPVGGGVLSGAVTHNDVPMPQWPYRYWRDGFRSYGQTDASGRFRIEGLTGTPIRIAMPSPDPANPSEPNHQDYRTVGEFDTSTAQQLVQDVELTALD